MDFSKNAFQSITPVAKVSNDTMSHTNLVMACRWGWSSTPDPDNNVQDPFSSSSQKQTTTVSPVNNVRMSRFAPCQGRFYHQLVCSHRIRTDLVEDCGLNCTEPFGDALDTAFFCHECLQSEAAKIQETREAQHNAQYPPMDQMTKEQYDQWYSERRQMEDEFARDHSAYKLELMATTRPSHVCSTVRTTKEESDMAAEIDSLSLSLINSSASEVDHHHLKSSDRRRVNLMNDPSEQLHWNLNTLALDRGSCGIEYAVPSPIHEVPARRYIDEEELWRKPRLSD